MAIITLTTDFGTLDYYVPAFKGEILSACPAVQIVDVSNNVPAYQIGRAAYLLKNAYEHFPKRTIHVVRVMETYVNQPEIVVCTYNDHFFIAPNNGVLTMIFDSKPSAAVKIDDERIKIRTPHDLYCKAIRTLVYNGSLSDLGRPFNNLKERIVIRPVIYDNSIKGVVQHVDNYGNLITNISQNDAEALLKNGNMLIILRKNDYIDRLHENYSDVPHGEQLARFNSKGALEIAINCGRASDLLGLREGDNIKIQY
jgi:S-adenosylmethionine hydrolase